MNSLTIPLLNRQQSWAAIQNQVFPFLAAVLQAEQRYTLTVKPAKRSSEQNSKFHAICEDLAKSDLQWAGKRRDSAAWKVLLVSGHAVATKQGSDMVPGIENEFVNLRESTASMSKSRGSSLIEYAIAFCSMNGVKLSASERDI
jgi:hypothetical protein